MKRYSLQNRVSKFTPKKVLKDRPQADQIGQFFANWATFGGSL
jgi:hypothetical protein